jgi:tripartite-type tricarboxylate transporter receptor subunit TctC
MRRRDFVFGTAAMSAAFAMPAAAQAYPDKPVRIVVPNAPGGAADIVARMFQPVLQRGLGQGVAVANVVGGGNSIGIRTVRDAAPDGHTALCIHQGLLSAAALKVMDFGPEALAPVAQVGSEFTVLAVNAKSPYKTLPEFIAAAKAGDLKAGVAIGALNHLQFIIFGEKVGTKFRYVNTGGGGPTRTALAGGHIDCSWSTVNEVKPLVDSGDIHIVCAFAPQRMPNWPNVATAREQGVNHVAGLDYWWWMPKATAADRVDRFAEALRAALQDPEIAKRFADANIAQAFLKGAPLDAEINRQYAEIKDVVARNNVAGT